MRLVDRLTCQVAWNKEYFQSKIPLSWSIFEFFRRQKYANKNNSVNFYCQNVKKFSTFENAKKSNFKIHFRTLNF